MRLPFSAAAAVLPTILLNRLDSVLDGLALSPCETVLETSCYMGLHKFSLLPLLFLQYWVGLTYADGDVARMALMSLWCVSEPIRLAAGWYGNLQENVR